MPAARQTTIDAIFSNIGIMTVEKVTYTLNLAWMMKGRRRYVVSVSIG